MKARSLCRWPEHHDHLEPLATVSLPPPGVGASRMTLPRRVERKADERVGGCSPHPRQSECISSLAPNFPPLLPPSRPSTPSQDCAGGPVFSPGASAQDERAGAGRTSVVVARVPEMGGASSRERVRPKTLGDLCGEGA